MALPRDFFSKKKGPARPNVIFCMADDMGWGDPGFNGNSIIKTGNLDAMAEVALQVGIHIDMESSLQMSGICARKKLP